MLRFSKKLSGEKRAPSCTPTLAALRKPLLAAAFLALSPAQPPRPPRVALRGCGALCAQRSVAPPNLEGARSRPTARKVPCAGLRGSRGSRGSGKGRCAQPPTVFSVRGAQHREPPPLRHLPSGRRRWENAVPTGRTDTRTGLPARAGARPNPKNPKGCRCQNNAGRAWRCFFSTERCYEPGIEAELCSRCSRPRQLLFLSLFLF